jgi:entericidin A
MGISSMSGSSPETGAPMMKTIAMLIAAAFVLAGCNTMKGFGEDMQKAGQKIEDTAKKK